MSYQKPRSQHDYKDLIWSLIPLVLICVVLAAVASQCTFSAKGPTPGRIPDFDAHSALADDARNLSFPIREPQLPQGWKPNSGSRDTVTGTGGGAISTVGFITPQGTYMQVTQSDATVPALADHVASTRTPAGSQQLDGQKWTVFHTDGSESAWIADFGNSRVLIKGAGNQAAYSALASAVDTAPVLPH